MSGTIVDSLDDIYKKWEKRGEERRNNPSRSLATGINSNVQPGRSAWARTFESSALPKRRISRRKNKDFHESHSTNPMLFGPVIERKFHLIPAVIKNIHRSAHPFLSTGCPRCSQKSKAMFVSEKVTSRPLRNLLDLSVFCRKSLFRRAFSDVLYVANLPSVTNQTRYPDLKNAVLKSPRVSSTIEKITSTDNQSDESSASLTSKELHLEARRIITGMSSCIKGYLIKLCTWFLLKFFGKIVSSIQVHQGQIAMLHEASRKNIPLVYLPFHKSHVDYVLISFVLSCYGVKVPYIAAGDNLKGIPLLSWLMRNMGGFFIKRSLIETSPENQLYKEILNEYILQILESGNSLEFFIEGTRSRTGKSYPPKIGVLSSVVSAVKEGRVSDVLIVPVNISYEKIFEEGYSAELLGVPKNTESFLQVVKSIWRIVRGHFGQIRVDFGLPSSLMEYIHVSETSEACQAFMKTLATKRVVIEQLTMKNSASEISLQALDHANVTVAKCIAHHVIYDCIQCSTIMGTNMVAFLLLTSFRKGVKMKDLVSALELLKKDILIRKRDFGFSGCNEAVISHSIKLLGEELVSWDASAMFIQPNLDLPAILQLSYYANQVISVYALESIIACSIGALLDDKDISLAELISQDVIISRRELLDTALDLCDLLHLEFVFSPPCVSLETSLIEAIESLIAADILNVCEDQSAKSREKQWTNRLAVSTAWLDDDENNDEIEIPDQEYKVNPSEEPLKKLNFFHSILSPTIESYWCVACGLLLLKDQEFSEKDFVKALSDSAIRRVEIGTALYSESCSSVHITNAVKVFKECNILHLDQGDKMCGLLVKLSNGYQSVYAILDLIGQINRYKT